MSRYLTIRDIDGNSTGAIRADLINFVQLVYDEDSQAFKIKAYDISASAAGLTIGEYTHQKAATDYIEGHIIPFLSGEK